MMRLSQLNSTTRHTLTTTTQADGRRNESIIALAAVIAVAFLGYIYISPAEPGSIHADCSSSPGTLDQLREYLYRSNYWDDQIADLRNRAYRYKHYPEELVKTREELRLAEARMAPVLADVRAKVNASVLAAVANDPVALDAMLQTQRVTAIREFADRQEAAANQAMAESYEDEAAQKAPERAAELEMCVAKIKEREKL